MWAPRVYTARAQSRNLHCGGIVEQPSICQIKQRGRGTREAGAQSKDGRAEGGCLPRLGFSFPAKILRAVDFPIPVCTHQQHRDQAVGNMCMSARDCTLCWLSVAAPAGSRPPNCECLVLGGNMETTLGHFARWVHTTDRTKPPHRRAADDQADDHAYRLCQQDPKPGQGGAWAADAT